MKLQVTMVLVLAALGGCLITGCFARTHKQPGAAMLDNKVAIARVEAALRSHRGYVFPNVHVGAAKNEVLLSGSVQTIEQKQQAAQLAHQAGPETRIRNEIAVQPPTAAGAGSPP
jgi:osmotically-inducible protein OsmY